MSGASKVSRSSRLTKLRSIFSALAHYWGAIESGLRAIDIWIGEEGDLGCGYGTEMMSLALERCFSNAAVGAVLVDPLANNSEPAASMSGSAFALSSSAPSATTTVSSIVLTVMHGGRLFVTRRSHIP